jgi:diaminopimelate decarboxylase
MKPYFAVYYFCNDNAGGITMNALGHFKTITWHKLLVMHYCFRVGLIRQGLLHDLSKYSWTEFRVGAKYYTGTHSPNASERNELGYSTAWLHHKGRNRHHLEYWVDYGGKDLQLMGQPMPTKYMVELCMDRIAACRVYHGKSYTDRDPLDYLNMSKDARLMHPDTKRQVVDILTMLAEQGEDATLKYIRNVVLKHPVKYYKNLPPKEVPPETKDATFISGEEIKQLAAQGIPTPFYLYDASEIQERCQTLNQAFSWNPGHRQFFPVKATPTPAILRLLQQQGQGVVCSSAAELELCRRCGFQASEIMFMPNYPTQEDLDMAEALQCQVILDGPDLVGPMAKRSLLRGTVGLRLNPGGVFRYGNSEVRLEGVKFGMSPEAAKTCIRQLQEQGVTSVGIHSYLAGNTLEPDYYPAAARLLRDVAAQLSQETGVEIAYINISGGLGIAYQPEDTPLDLTAIGREVEKVFVEGPLQGVPIYTELGRYITGPAGILVTKVTHVRKGFRNFAGVDASAANLMRPMMYGSYHHISAAGKEGTQNRQPWDVVGTVCENTDKFAENRQLPELEVGDLLVIHDVGAHGHSMGYQYGGRLRCGEYLRSADGTITMIRRPETAEDYLQTAIF